jgi:hypothetical protein
MSLHRLLAGMILLICTVVLVGCDTRRFNDPDEFGIRFNNDLSIPIVLAICHSDHSAKCEHPYYRDHIKPGGATTENIGVDVRSEWAIENQDGRPLRCIVLYWKYWPGHDMQVKVSHTPSWAWPCPPETAARPVG